MEQIPNYISEEDKIVTRNQEIKEIFIAQINKVEYIDPSLFVEYNANINEINKLREEGSRKPYDK